LSDTGNPKPLSGLGLKLYKDIENKGDVETTQTVEDGRQTRPQLFRSVDISLSIFTGNEQNNP
jgi:hypothetical protein